MTVAISKLIGLKEQARKEGWADWIRTERDERAVLAGMRFSQQRLDRVVQFGAKNLRHSEGHKAGTPFHLMDWQYNELFGPLFGWIKYNKHFSKWVRRYDRVYCEVPKKNGKSPTGAFVGLYMLCGDNEKGAKVFSAATDKDQASIVHSHAINMVDASPKLSKLLRVNRTTRCIYDDTTKSLYRVVSGIASSQEGLNAHCIICDELHVWPGRELWDAIKWAFASRSEPILFLITTAGEDLQSVCYEQREYAQSVNNGDIEDQGFLGLIYAMDEKDDPHDEAVWKKANPSLGVIIDPERFRTDYQEAAKSPASFRAFQRYRLNRWGLSADAWIERETWENARRVYSLEDFVGKDCWLSLDLAQTKDSVALTVVAAFEEEDKTHYRSLTWFWMPRKTVEDRDKLVPYFNWEHPDVLTITPGEVQDYGYVKEKMKSLQEKGLNIVELVYDQRFAEQFTLEVENELGIPRLKFPQTIEHFSEPMKEMERMLPLGLINHVGNPMLNWQVGNIKVYYDPNQNRRPTKPKKGDYRQIDGVVSLIMAFARCWKSNEPTRSFYESNEVEIG